jgi:protein phosphatase
MAGPADSKEKAGKVGFWDWLKRVLGQNGAAPRRRPDGEPTIEVSSVPAVSLPVGNYELKVGVVTTTGNVREHNEDNYYIPGRAARSGGVASGSNPRFEPLTPDGPSGLFIVADGMGGQLAGEKASEMAVEMLPSELSRRLGNEDDDKNIKRAIREGVAEVNKEILAQSHLVTEFANMGTTVVLALFRGERVFISGIGDSRAYRLREGRIERLTKDHSLADALGEAGTIRPEEVENHKFRHVLYLYLGSKDARDGPEEIRALDVRPGDRFLLASDGLTGFVRDDVITEVLCACDDPQRAAQVLVNRAIEHRSKDNITCVVIYVI